MTTVYVWTVSSLVFVSELLMLAALAVASYRFGGADIVGVIVAVLVVMAAAALWGLFAAPRAKYDIPAMVWSVKLGLYASATALLAATGARTSVVLAFASFSVVVNALASMPPVKDATLGAS